MRALMVVVALACFGGCEFPPTKMVPVAPTQPASQSKTAPSSSAARHGHVIAAIANTNGWG